MITITNETYNNIPTLHVVEDKQSDNLKLPTIFFLHGFTSAKEHNLPIAYMLAEAGYRVILPDALHHGKRELDITGEDRNVHFWSIVTQSIEEINVLRESLVNQKVIEGDHISLAGTSMGAITTYGALTQYEWIHSAVAFMGTAYYESFAKEQLSQLEEAGTPIQKEVAQAVLNQIEPFDLSKQLDKIGERPVFIWHGENDLVVPYKYTEQLKVDLAKKNSFTNQLTWMTEPRVDHKVSRAAMLEAVNWLESNLIKECRKASVR